MKNILVPTDFSRNASDALFYVTRLFKKEKCNFYILNTFEVKTPAFTSRVNTEKGENLYKKQSAESECKLKEVIHVIVKDTEDFDHHFTTISSSQPLVEVIEKTVISKKIDLVAMGTKGATGAKEIFMGSNTVKVIDEINSSPILAIPQEVDIYPIYHIAFPTEFTHQYNKESIAILKSYCELDDAILKIIHISEDENLTETQEKNKKQLEGYLKDIKHSTIAVNKHKSIEKHISDMVEYLEFDLLAMIKYRHGFIKKITREAVIKKLGYHTKKPLLIIPDKLINIIF